MRAAAPLARPPQLTSAVAFVLLLLAVRALFLLGALDPSQERAREVIEATSAPGAGVPERPLYDREELYTGTAAEAIRTGVPLPLAAYRFMPYASGSLLLSLAVVPVYALFGPHYLAFKLIPLFVTVVGGLFWFLAARRWLGRRAALLFGGLYIFAPAVLARTALIAKGDHPEAMALIGAVLYLATRAAAAIDAPDARRAARWAAAAGLLTGLGVYVTYSSVPVLAGIGLVALARTRLRPRRVWAAFAVGLGVGLLPWLAFVLTTSGGALLVYGRAPGAGIATVEIWSRTRHLIGSGFMAGYDLPNGALRTLAALAWLAAVIAGWVTLIRARRGPFALVALAALTGTCAHLAAFLLVAPDASSRYLIPCYPLLLIAVVAWALPVRPQPIALDNAIASRRSPAALAWGLLIAIGLFSQIWAVQDSRFVALRRPLAGTDWPLLGEIVGAKLTPQAIARLPEAVRPHFWTGYGRQVFRNAAPAQWAESVAVARDEERRHIWFGIGIGWCESWRLAEAAAYLPTLAPEPRAALRDGLLRYGDYIFASLIATEGLAPIGSLLARFAPDDRPAVQTILARALAVMATHGAPIVKRAGPALPGRAGDGSAVPDPSSPRWNTWLDETCGAQRVREAAAWALCRELSGARLRLWHAPRSAWTAPFAAQVRATNADAALWEGIAAVYERDLQTVSPRWLIGNARGSGGLEREIAAITRSLNEPAASAIRRSGERALQTARRDPAIARASVGQ
jgi:4-amino-4-deoxy-L-arabinose transferase-like glycosyltransferase